MSSARTPHHSEPDAEEMKLRRILKETGARRRGHDRDRDPSEERVKSYPPFAPTSYFRQPPPTAQTAAVASRSGGAEDAKWITIDDVDVDETAQLSRRMNSLGTHTFSTSTSGSAAAAGLADGPSVAEDERLARELQAKYEREAADAKFARELFEREQEESVRRSPPPAPETIDDDAVIDEDSPTHTRSRSRGGDGGDGDSGFHWAGSLGNFGLSFSFGRPPQMRSMGLDEDSYRERIRALQSAMFDGHRSGMAPFGYGRMFGGSNPDVENMSYEELLELGERMGQVKPRGIEQQLLESLPTHTITKSASSQSSLSAIKADASDEKQSSGARGGDDNRSCAICMCEFEAGDEVRQLPCFHQFHQSEIDQWLASNDKCPICNTSVTQGLRDSEERTHAQTQSQSVGSSRSRRAR